MLAEQCTALLFTINCKQFKNLSDFVKDKVIILQKHHASTIFNLTHFFYL